MTACAVMLLSVVMKHGNKKKQRKVAIKHHKEIDKKTIVISLSLFAVLVYATLKEIVHFQESFVIGVINCVTLCKELIEI